MMPDEQKTPVWFLNNVILPMFKDLARIKNFAIKNTNNALLSMKQPNNHLGALANNVCQSCHLIFDTKSKPSLCSKCSKYFHKTKCLRDHSKVCLIPSHTPIVSASVLSALDSSGNVHQPTSVTSTRALPPIDHSFDQPTAAPTVAPTAAPNQAHPAGAASRLNGLPAIVSFIPGLSSSTAVPNQAPTQKPPPPPSHPAPAASRLDGRQTIVSFIPQASSSSYTPDPTLLLLLFRHLKC